MGLFKKGAKSIGKAMAKKVGVFFVAKIFPILLLISIVAGIVGAVAKWAMELITAEDIANATYEDLNVDTLTDLVVINGDEQNGYHLEFVSDIDTKLKNTLRKLNRQNESITEKDLETLKKFIMAEAATGFPNLNGDATESIEVENISTTPIDIKSKAKEVAAIIKKEKFTYGNPSINPGKNYSDKIISSASFVSWVLYELGFQDQPDGGLRVKVPSDNSKSLEKYLEDKGFKKITVLADVKDGDIVFTDKDKDKGYPTNVVITRGKKQNSNQDLVYDYSKQENIGIVQPMSDKIDNFICAYRISEETGDSTEDRVEGIPVQMGNGDRFQGAINIKRAMPDKAVGEVKNATKVLASNSTGSIVETNDEGLGTKTDISETIKNVMEGASMRNLSGTTYEELSYLTIPYFDFNGNEKKGNMVVNKAIADEVLLIFQELYKIKYPIERMELIDKYKTAAESASGNEEFGNKLDNASMEDNNTSSFNDRKIGGSNNFSLHASGQAIDVNPQINPYVYKNGSSSPENADKFAKDRDKMNGWTATEKKAKIDENSEIYKIFIKYGWTWLGNMQNGNHDYQHFEKTDLSDVATIKIVEKVKPKETTENEDNNTTATETAGSGKQYVVAVAAGHSTSSPGAYAKMANGTELREEVLNLKVADYVEQLFAPYKNIKVVQTGNTLAEPNRIPQNAGRWPVAYNANPDVCIQVHFNAGGGNYTMAYYKPNDGPSQQLAKYTTDAMSSHLGIRSEGAVTDAAHGRNLSIIKPSSETGFANIVTEGAFLDYEPHQQFISTEKGLEDYAKGIVDGILKYFNEPNSGYGQTTSGGGFSQSTVGEVNSKIFTMRYVPKDIFDEYVEAQDPKALEVYTLTNKRELVIAGWSYNSSSGITITEQQPINYTPTLRKFEMSYEYLIAFLVDAESKEFVEGLADLALNSEFIIAVQDNVTTTSIKTVQTMHTVRYGRWTGTEDLGRKVIKDETIITEVSNQTIELTYADAWFVKFYKDVSYNDGIEGSTIGSGYTLTGQKGENLGNFKLTAYCNCAQCCGKWAGGPTASGTMPQEGRTVAMGGMNFGEALLVGDKVYIVEDRGTPYGHIDIYMDDHDRCLQFGVQYADVYKIPKGNYSENSSGGSTSSGTGIDNSINYIRAMVTDVTTQNTSSTTNGYSTNDEYRNEETTTTDIENRTITYKFDSGEKYVVGNEDKFVELYKYRDKKNFALEPEWLFDILEQNPRTAEKIELTKYLLYRATGKDFGVKEFDYSKYQENDFNSLKAGSVDISLYKSLLDRETFIKALDEHASKTGNVHFIKNFQKRAGDIYDWGVKYDINPELIVTMALKESGYKASGNNQNFWGLGTPNGKELAYVGSFEEGVKQLASSFEKYGENSSTWHKQAIEQRRDERAAADCNSNGYGDPGTLKGMLSIYSDLCGENTKHREGNAGDGGNYYMKVIYGDEFNAKCGSVHQIGVTDYTIQEKADYTAWLYEKQLQYWQTIFGNYATLGGGGTVVDEAIKLHQYLRTNGYYYVQAGVSVPNLNGRTIDCSSFVTWVLVNAKVEGFTEGMYQRKSGDFYSNNMGWATVSVNDAQPGDILVYSGHVEIVAANDPNSDRFKVYNCGSDSAINAAGTPDLPESSGSRLKSQVLKVLRPPT